MPPRFAGLDPGGDDVISLFVLGLSVNLYPGDSETAKAIHDERHMQPWPGDNSLLVDRWDVRLLLDDLRPFEEDVDPSKEEAGQELKAELDMERFRDLQEAQRHEEESDTGVCASWCERGVSCLLIRPVGRTQLT